MLHAAVITISDRVSQGRRVDRSGPLAVELLRAADCQPGDPVVVPDDPEAIQTAILTCIEEGARVVLTTGGTGVAPRDQTPEATGALLTAELPGISEAIRSHSADQVPTAILSRGLAGVIRRAGRSAFVLNAPGSTGGVRDAIAVVGPLLAHLVDQLDGGDHA